MSLNDIHLLIISVRGSLWQECVSIEKDPASKKTNKIRKSDLLLIDLAPGGPGKCSALKRGSCQGRSPVFMKFVLIKGTKGRFSCDNHNDFILFFFSSNTPNSSQLDFQRYWLSIWLPSFSCWCDLLAVDSYKNWFLINITTNARITWIFWVKIETYLGRVESMLDVATLMLLGRVASHSDDFVLKYSKIKIKMWNFGLVWDHDQSIWKPHWRNQGEKWQAPSSSDLD